MTRKAIPVKKSVARERVKADRPRSGASSLTIEPTTKANLLTELADRPCRSKASAQHAGDGTLYVPVDGAGDLFRQFVQYASSAGSRKLAPSHLEAAATRIVSALRLALEAHDARALRAADNWAREYLDDHEPRGGRRLTLAEAGKRLVTYAARVLKIKTWNQERALEEGCISLVLGIHHPSRAEHIAAAMIARAMNLHGGSRYVVKKFDARLAARTLADEIVNRGLATMQPRPLARLAAQAVGTPADEIPRLFAATKKEDQRRQRRLLQ